MSEERMARFEKRREELHQMTDEQLKARFWELCEQLVDPIVDLARTFGVSASTIYRDLTLIQTDPFYQDVRQRTIWYIEAQTDVR